MSLDLKDGGAGPSHRQGRADQVESSLCPPVGIAPQPSFLSLHLSSPSALEIPYHPENLFLAPLLPHNGQVSRNHELT